jgi:hypothetical protein
MFPWLTEPEPPAAEARSDVLAWVAGGILWGVVTSLGQGHPVGLAFGAGLALVLRRALRLLVAF